MHKKILTLFAVVIGFLPYSLFAQDFSGGISKPKEYAQRDAVGYAVYSIHWDNRGKGVDLGYMGTKYSLKPEYEHCISCGAKILFWPDGVAYVSMEDCVVEDLGSYDPHRTLDSRLHPPYPSATYVANATYTVNGPRLTLTYKDWRGEWRDKEFTAFENGKFKNECGTIRFDEERLKILTQGTHEMRYGSPTSPSYPTIRVIHD